MTSAIISASGIRHVRFQLNVQLVGAAGQLRRLLLVHLPALRLAASAYPTNLPHTDRSSKMRLPPWRVPGVLFAALTAFVGCASDSTAPEPEPTFIGTWAGEAWSGDVAVSYGQQGDTMYISGSSPAGAGQSLSSIVTIRIL